MKPILSILFCLSIIFSVFADEVQEPVIASEQESRLHWYENYQDALLETSETGKSLFILFTGSDWCSWCQKFEKEVLSQANFQKSVENSFVFLKIDFRIDLKDDIEKFNEYQALKTQYGAKGFPSVVIVNKDEEIMGVTGYLPGGASDYSKHIASLIDSYQEYADKINDQALKNATPEELEELYKQSMQLNRNDDQARIMNEGLLKDWSGFFYAESYRQLVDDGQYRSEDAQAMRSKLLDPNLAHHIDNARFVAIIDFQESLDNDEQAKALDPLMQFLNQYGDKDPENTWKVQMVISQFHSDHNDFIEALEYAEQALSSAPENIREDIEEAVRFLKIEVR
jgi:protein disulfide-isomerase